MSDAKTPAPLPQPLVSDEILAHLNCRCENCVRRVAQVIEADRAKAREVVQALLNYIAYRNDVIAKPEAYYASGGLSYAQCVAFAKSQLNIEPTKP